MVACREDTGHDNCIDEAPCHMRPDHLEDNGKWRGASVLGVQARIGVRDVKSNEQD
jgi:hypothetical protein